MRVGGHADHESDGPEQHAFFSFDFRIFINTDESSKKANVVGLFRNFRDDFFYFGILIRQVPAQKAGEILFLANNIHYIHKFIGLNQQRSQEGMVLK
ncbi:MAG TPA: hypothetical protein PK878_11650 [bacterium]|nr:hypothetical protein [Candidatus Omnitrophota bacterium]HOJ60933.1 hypothetical protein [bacterium]HOL93622.1 hypothetical protein [bacterium]HPP00093.1 hypothetical protein [bacterium]HXK94029.1 hypothetical protein [bacterium]